MQDRRRQGFTGPGGGERSEPEPGPVKPCAHGSQARVAPGGEGAGPGRGSGRSKRYTPEERRWALEAWSKSGVSAQMFARQWGLSVPTLYEWRRAMARGGPQGLEHPASTLGVRPGAKQLPAAVQTEIVAVKRQFPDFGLRKVRDYLARFVALRVSTGGIRAALVRAEVPSLPPPKRRGRRREVVRRFERARPGELWQSDITSYVLARESRQVYLTVFLDDHSRYVVAWALASQQRQELVMECLLDGIARFGKPKEVLTDQGRQYFAWRGKSGFQKLLVREGIEHVVSRTHHPETLGKCERLWETVGRELWDRAHPQDLPEARERLGHYFAHYNHFRPHQGLSGMVPADRFFGAESEVRKAIEASIGTNELRMALGERPRRAVYLVGQVDGEMVSLHGERGRLVVSTRDGVKDVDLNELGMEQEVRGGADGDDDSGGGGPGASRGDEAAPASQDGGRLPAAGVPDQRDLGRGDGGGAEEGACAVQRAAGILAGPREQGGALEAAAGPAGPRVADVAAGLVGDGGSAAQAADGEARSDAEDRSGGEGPAEAGGRTRGGDRPAEAADHAAQDDAGERVPRAPEGGAGCCEPQAQEAEGEGGRRRSAAWSWSFCGVPSEGGVTPHGSQGSSA